MDARHQLMSFQWICIRIKNRTQSSSIFFSRAFKATVQDNLFEALQEQAVEDGIQLPNNLTVTDIMNGWTKQRGYQLFTSLSAQIKTHNSQSYSTKVQCFGILYHRFPSIKSSHYELQHDLNYPSSEPCQNGK